MIKSFLKNKVVKNAGWMIGEKIVQMLISLIVGVLTARYLGPSNQGLIDYAGAYTAFFSSLCTLGINNILVKEFIDHPDEDGEILGSSILLRLLSSALSVITIIGIVCIVDRDDPTAVAVVALSTVGILFHVFEVFNYWFQAQLLSKVTSTAALVAYAVMTVYKVFLLVTGKDVKFFAVTLSVDYIVIGVFLYICYKKYKGSKLRISIDCCKRILRQSAPFILPGLMVAIYAQTDKFMLKQLLSAADVSYYARATSLCSMWCFILNAIIASLHPPIMEDNKNGNEEEFERKNKLLYAIVFYLSMIVSVLFVLLANPVICILYGAEYLPAAYPLRIATWYTAFSYLGVARNAWIVCKNAQKYLIWIYLSAAVANVALNALLIPIWGPSGAAFASLISQIITSFVVPFFIKPLRKNSMLMVDAILLKGLKRKNK